jgi:hypothetical protein
MKMGIETSNRKLKHLGFIRVIAIYYVISLLKLYEYAKLKSGPFRSTIQTLEFFVIAVLAPFYDRAKGLPDDILVFLDNKADVATIRFNEHAPALAKSVVIKVHSMIVILVQEAEAGGPNAAIHYAAQVFKTSSTRQFAKLLYAFDKIPPPFESVARKAAPSFANLSDTCNTSIKRMTAKGYTVFTYFPLIPIDQIAEEFNNLIDAKQNPNA